MYFEVCYLDLNGPNNMAGVTDAQLLKRFPPWDPKQVTSEAAPRAEGLRSVPTGDAATG